MTTAETTLCFPDGEKSCFACCPPIRPAGYDHLDYRGLISRMLLENTKAFNPDRQDIRPITGFSCWAMGYLDEGYRTVGCLLHPYRHGGVDMRHRVAFEDKCRRETCEEAKIFQALSCRAQTALLSPVKGMDSFTYSSRKANPVFRLLLWGVPLLEAVANEAGAGRSAAYVQNPFKSWSDFYREYPFFESSLSPSAHAYVVTSLVLKKGTVFLKRADAHLAVEALCAEVQAGIRKVAPEESEQETWTHLIDLPRPFLDYLRLGAGIRKINPRRAALLKEMIDGLIEKRFF